MDELNFDYNKIAVELSKEFTSFLYETLRIKTVDAYKTISSKFEKTFAKYLKTSISRYSQTKTLLYKDKPVSLKNIYVPTDLLMRNKKLSTDSIDNLFVASNRI